jgi:hypothetical protein
VANEAPVSLADIDSAPDDAAPAAGDTLVSIDDYRKALARVGGEKDAIQAELEKLQKRIRTIEILDELIEPMAVRSFTFMCIYCGIVGEMVLFHGFTLFGFKLPESVLNFLVGSTATTVIGLVGMVLTGVFVGARRNGKD